MTRSDRKLVRYGVPILIGIGILLAGYLHYAYVSRLLGGAGATLCSMLPGGGDCNAAQASSWSKLFGIPLSAWGIIYYVILILLLYFDRVRGSDASMRVPGLVLFFTGLGAGAAVFLLVVMFGGWSPVCSICVLMHLINLALFLLVLSAEQRRPAALLRALRASFGEYLSGTEALHVRQKLTVAGMTAIALAGIALMALAYIIELELRIGNLRFNEKAVLSSFASVVPVDVPIHAKDATLGSSDAPLRVVLFSDFQCPSCMRLALELGRMEQAWGPDACLVFKHLPLDKKCNPALDRDIHPRSCEAARAAIAAGQQGRFWLYHDKLFRQGVGRDSTRLMQLADECGLDRAPFLRAFRDPATAAQVRDDVGLALRLGVSGTPALFISGRKVPDMRPRAVHFLIEYLLREIRNTRPLPPVTLPLTPETDG